MRKAFPDLSRPCRHTCDCLQMCRHFLYKYTKLIKSRKFFKKAVTNTKLLLEYTKWRLCLMSKKRLVTLILSIGIFLSLAATVFAAGQPRRYNENSTVKGTISQSFYQVNAKTDVAVKRITVTGTLYEKGTFGTWQKVSSCSNTSTSSSCSASSNYNTKPGRSYRLECSATFTYSNGQSETITSTASH